MLDGDIARAIKNVANCIRLHKANLRMDTPGERRPSMIRPQDDNAKESHHRREQETVVFHLQHLFVASNPASNQQRVTGRSV